MNHISNTDKIKSAENIAKIAFFKTFKNSELLQELACRIKDKRIRFTQRLEGQCIGGLLYWDEQDKYWLELTELDDNFTRYAKTHWHALETEPEEEKVIFNCQECQAPIKMSQPKKKGGLKVLEFYGKWTGQGHNLVCQKCLENKSNV